jgi:hypothetical protein
MDQRKSTEQESEDFSKSLDRLKAESKELKTKIEQEKPHHGLPLDSKLGDPSWEEQAADGHSTFPTKTTTDCNRG